MHGLRSGHDFVVIGTPTENGVFADYEKGAIDVPMEDGVMNGKGTEKLTKNNEEYTLECTWVNGKKNGEAVLLDSNSVMSMKLFFKDDLIEGEGYLYDNGQVTFKGTWVAGKRCGFGQEFQGGKLLFKGQYKDDVRNGYGTLYDANGEVAFEGEWVDGKEGESTIEEDDNGDRVLVVKKDGVLVYRGGFKEGTMVKDGKGVLYNSEGKPEKVCIFKEGTIDRMVKEFKENTIVIYDANGKKVYEGEYLNDSQGRYPANGSGRAFHNGALIYKGEWVRGRRQGRGCSYYENHMLKYEGDWQNDQANGNGKFFDAEGMLVLEGEFVDGVGTDGEKRVLVESGKVESATKSGGCACFGGRKEGRRQLPVMGEEENPAGKGMVVVHTMKEFTAVPLQAVGICFHERDGGGDSGLRALREPSARAVRRGLLPDGEAGALPRAGEAQVGGGARGRAVELRVQRAGGGEAVHDPGDAARAVLRGVRGAERGAHRERGVCGLYEAGAERWARRGGVMNRPACTDRTEHRRCGCRCEDAQRLLLLDGGAARGGPAGADDADCGKLLLREGEDGDHKRWGLLGDVREQICRSWSACALVRERARDSRTCSTRGTTRRNCGVDEER